MKRRSKVGGGRAKAQGRDASKLKHRSSSKCSERLNYRFQYSAAEPGKLLMRGKAALRRQLVDEAW